MAIKAIIFDWNDTITDQSSTFSYLLEKKIDQKIMQNFGIKVDDEVFLSGMRKTNKELRKVTSIKAKELPGLWTKIFFKQIGLKVDDEISKLIQEEYENYYLLNIKLNPNVAETVSVLKQKKIQLFLLTNCIRSSLNKELAKFGFGELFSKIVTGSDAGEKTTSEPFKLLLGIMQNEFRGEIRPQDCLMVGNSPENDLLAAKFGIHTAIYDKTGKYKDLKGMEFHVKDFLELVQLVDEV
ncbi:MAG: HAD family hydrolase [Candidatus Woesearchaeota archaeon]